MPKGKTVKDLAKRPGPAFVLSSNPQREEYLQTEEPLRTPRELLGRSTAALVLLVGVLASGCGATLHQDVGLWILKRPQTQAQARVQLAADIELLWSVSHAEATERIAAALIGPRQRPGPAPAAASPAVPPAGPWTSRYSMPCGPCCSSRTMATDS